ncbi:hypothetical protein CPB84DRAFT_1778673 [Gymnopilus junonius]|uniref:DUF7907 domain-containing protein n=1 Tax=Gymnopilus junonius TaxID=109634 RepID=A0A9P5TN16_GYMJU|nr:hypothetical protein CPB84DRAFT_1778673 [Gymnopilus junonius]
MNDSSTIPSKQQYFLKTAPLLPSVSNSKFGNLYLRHHSGGINAIMVMPSPPKFIKANSDTYPASVFFTSASHPGRQWGLVLGRNKNAREDKLGAWEEVLIVEDEGDQGFAWQATGDVPGREELVWIGNSDAAVKDAEDEAEVPNKDSKQNKRWKGWMVCEWQYEHPQLFWVTDELKSELPEFCERVRIWREMLE